MKKSALAASFLLLGVACAYGAEAGLSDLQQGIAAYNARNFSGAISHLRSARSVTRLSDYVTYDLAYS
ncbi:MAG: hypothetical protein M3N93_10215, partial [Acidobacteriota bacterium]|nr:hypothetical protein [Acidobacteriota bacterium]